MRVAAHSTAFVDTPRGIFTASGVWFRASEEEVRQYAGPVLEHASLEGLLARAEVWLRSPETIALWLLPVLLWGLAPGWAVAAVMAAYLLWKTLAPALVNWPTVQVLRWLDHVALQAALYVVLLSLLAIDGQHGALVAGLAGFILLRWGVVRGATDPLVRPLWKRLYPLPVADQVLRALVHRVALKHRVALPTIDAMADDILAIWYRTK